MRTVAPTAVVVLAALCGAPGCGESRAVGVDDDAAAALDATSLDDGDAVSVLDAAPAADDATAPMDAGAPGDAGGDDAGPADDAGADAGAPGAPFSVVVLPDTQYYAAAFPDIFESQARYIVNERAAQNIAFVLHEGDIVDSDLPAQWQVASRALHMLDGVVPYVLAAGNHDYANLADRMGMMNDYFPPSVLAEAPTFGGTFEEGHSENSFSVVSAGGQTWLLLALEFGPRDEVLQWADGVLKSHASASAIVVTHAYLFGNERYDHGHGPARPWNPHDYVMAGQPGTSINDGEEVWRKLVQPNSNIKLVVSGHVIQPAVGRMTSRRPDGTRVHQVLANYQSCAYPCETLDGVSVKGGNGFLRILRFDPAARTISFTTYSPYLDEYKHDPGNEFTLPWD